MFRLNSDLLDRLKEMAKRENRSLNNFVECILLDVAYSEPNEETRQSHVDAQNHKYLPDEVDTTSVDTLLRSCGL